MHFWDDKKIIGRWFDEHPYAQEADSGIVWDAYYLCGPDAKWEAKPGPLLSGGGTARNKFVEIQENLLPFMTR
jgi:hypothetical protein